MGKQWNIDRNMDIQQGYSTGNSKGPLTYLNVLISSFITVRTVAPV